MVVGWPRNDIVRGVDPVGRCVVVTGGGHGIGRALAERFARDGARVVVADVHEARAEKIADRVGGMAVRCDVASPGAMRELVARAVDAFGPVYAFCSNAGIGGGGGLDTSIEDVERVVGVNLLAHVWAAQAVVPTMVEQGEGYLLQTLSSAALITGPSPMGYTMTKHGALGLAEWIALNYSHLGIRVACLCPNAVNTGFFGRDEDAEDAAGATAEDRASAMALGDVVEPELCADLAVDALRDGRFLVLPHPRVGESFLRKAGDYDRWLEGTNRRLRRMAGEDV
jgi:NAD(P)-dependent dehydrogenase (short-subunit alcohol dehydrogenase family)